MNFQRRRFIRMAGSAIGALGASLMLPLRALAEVTGLDAAFQARNLDDTFKSLGGTPEPSTAIQLTTPDIAENGAVVPVSVTSSLPKTEQIMVLVEKNPNPLAASFTFPEGTEPSISTRVKVGQTCNVYAVVKADGKLYSAFRETKVTLGGCGG